MALALPAQQSSGLDLGSILQALPGLANIFTGKTTSTSEGISSEGQQAMLTQLLSGTNGLAAVTGAQNSAGLYNSSTNTLLTNDLLTRAAGQVAQANKTSTTTVAPQIGAGKASAVLGGAGALLKVANAAGLTGKAKKGISDLLTGGNDSPSASLLGPDGGTIGGQVNASTNQILNGSGLISQDGAGAGIAFNDGSANSSAVSNFSSPALTTSNDAIASSIAGIGSSGAGNIAALGGASATDLAATGAGSLGTAADSGTAGLSALFGPSSSAAVDFGSNAAVDVGSSAAASGFSTGASAFGDAAGAASGAAPYAGAAIDALSGDYKGAAASAAGTYAGAAIGSAIFPGVGTAVGGAIGSIVGQYASPILSGIGDVSDAVGGFIGSIGDPIGGAITSGLGSIASGIGKACFITTVMVEHYGMADDCEELTVLRKFRDTYMQTEDHLKAKVTEYYEIAPGLAEKLKALPEGKETEDVFANVRGYIQLAVRSIKNDCEADAAAIYESMVGYVKEKVNG